MLSFNQTDSIKVKHKYAQYSTYSNDCIFKSGCFKKPLFCGGIIQQFKNNVYNFKKGEFVGYPLYSHESNTILSSNLVFKIDENDYNLLFYLPYASYAMKLLRLIKPRIGENYIIIGLNFFTYILLKLFTLSGAFVEIIKNQQENSPLNIPFSDQKFITNNIHNILDNFLKEDIKGVILSEVNENTQNIVTTFQKIKKKPKFYSLIPSNKESVSSFNSEIIYFSIFDYGREDPNYIRGVNYPHAYIRWDFKKNLDFFISLIRKNKLSLEFLMIKKYKISDIEESKRILSSLPKDLLILFEF